MVKRVSVQDWMPNHRLGRPNLEGTSMGFHQPILDFLFWKCLNKICHLAQPGDVVKGICIYYSKKQESCLLNREFNECYETEQLLHAHSRAYEQNMHQNTGLLNFFLKVNAFYLTPSIGHCWLVIMCFHRTDLALFSAKMGIAFL